MVNYLKNNLFVRKSLLLLKTLQVKIQGEEKWESKRFQSCLGYKPNIQSPQTLNEKIVWLKIHYFNDFFIECCDKYLIHSYLEKRLGYDYAPKLLYVTQNPKDLNYDNIKHFPCIIKVSNGSGANLIVKDKNQFTENYLQRHFAFQIIASKLHTITSLEHQYNMDKPYIVVEELLKDPNGGIPNDYKFLYINGTLEFVYCSVDRLGANVRHVYDENWNRLHFVWVAGADESIFLRYESSKAIPAPRFFEKMKQISSEIAKDFPLVRVDFYETEDRIYVGEITLHHGSGHDKFYPDSYDMFYGRKLILPGKNR